MVTTVKIQTSTGRRTQIVRASRQNSLTNTEKTAPNKAPIATKTDHLSSRGATIVPIRSTNKRQTSFAHQT
jgi:hypothetical protein